MQGPVAVGAGISALMTMILDALKPSISTRCAPFRKVKNFSTCKFGSCLGSSTADDNLSGHDWFESDLELREDWRPVVDHKDFWLKEGANRRYSDVDPGPADDTLEQNAWIGGYNPGSVNDMVNDAKKGGGGSLLQTSSRPRCWDLVKGFNLNYHNKETILFTLDRCYGNLNLKP